MKEFNELCKEAEQIDLLTYSAVLAQKSLHILPALREITEDGLSGAAIYASFIFGAIAADGRLSEDEYLLVYPMLRAFFGEEVDYETAKKVFASAGPERRALKKSAKEMAKVFGELDEDLRDDIVTVCLLITAIDGKVSLKEKAWIKKMLG